MSKGKALFNNTIIYSIGSIGSKVLSFALLPIYSFYLSKEELGVYDLILTSISLIIPIITLQLSQANYRWLFDIDDYEKIKVPVSNSFLSISALLFLSILIFISLSGFFEIPYITLFVALLVTNCYFIFFQDYARGIKKNKLYALSGIIYSLGLVGFTVIFLIVFKYDVEGILLASIISNLLTTLLLVIKTNGLQYIKIKAFSKDEVRRMIAYSGPLIPNTISWWLINAANRYIILWGMGTAANGLFAVSARFPGVLTIINSIFMLAWQDHTISDSENDTAFSKKIFELFYKFQLGVAIILAASSKYIVKYLFSNDYYDSWRYMGILFIAVAFSAFGAYYGAAYLREKKTQGLFYTTIFGGIVNILVSIFLIKKIALFAPAIGSLIGFIIVYIMRYKQTKPFFYINYDQKQFIGLSILALVVILLSLLDWSYLDFVLILSCTLLFFFINKESIYKIKSILLNQNRKQ